MMHSTFKALLLAATPLFTAGASGKRKPVKKASQKKTKSVSRRAQSTSKVKAAPRKSATRKGAAKAKPSATHEHTASPQKSAVAVSEKQERGEALPKPPAPIGRAIPLLPENEKYVDSVHPTFRWLSVGSATRYEIQWSEDPNLSNSYSIMSVATEVTIPVEKPLRVGPTYYWRVRGGNESGWGPWSSTSSFHVLEETE